MSTDRTIVAVIEAVAKADGVDPSEVDFTLSEHMDPDVLTKLEAMENGVWELTFRVSDHQVRISHDGSIFVDGMKHEPDTARQE